LHIGDEFLLQGKDGKLSALVTEKDQ